MSYSINTLKSDCYDGTSCLINKFDVKDETVLKELETTITLTKITEYSLNPLFNTFDVRHYKRMIATIQSANGVTDYLKDIFKYAIKK